MNSLRLYTLAATLASATALFSASAHASLASTGVACDGHGTSMTSLTGYLDCSGSWSGNNLNQASDVAGTIYSDWGLTVQNSASITAAPSGSAGTLSFAAQTGLFVIALKAGNAFSLYEFDGSQVAGGISSMSFDTLGVGFFSGGGRNEHFGQGLSHADLYSVATPVPEPASAALMMAGLGLVGFVARRRAR